MVRASVDRLKIRYPEVREAAAVVPEAGVFQISQITASRMFNREAQNCR